MYGILYYIPSGDCDSLTKSEGLSSKTGRVAEAEDVNASESRPVRGEDFLFVRQNEADIVHYVTSEMHYVVVLIVKKLCKISIL